MKNLSSFFLFFLLLFFFFLNTFLVQAAVPLDVIINEIAWMGTNISANDEWIELYNNTDNNINLEGWFLKSEDGTPEIKLTGIISANGFFLLERTDDETVANITADQIYKGALGNMGEKLKLYDNSGNLIDMINCSTGWFGGDNKTKQTMERKNSQISGTISSNWQTSQKPGGTPRTKNSEQKTISKEQETEKWAENTSPPTLIGKKEYPSGIIFNEILPSPEGADDKEEWIEIFNQNNFEIDISGWLIKDTSGKITTYTFPKGTKISGQGFLVLPRPITKITLNNSEDGLLLLQPNENILDKVNYQKAPRGQSYNRVERDFKVLPKAGSYNMVESKWVWSANLTPGAANIIEKPDARSLADEIASENKERRWLATVGEQNTNSSLSSFLPVLLTALAIAIFSGIVILFLKKKLKKIKNDVVF